MTDAKSVSPPEQPDNLTTVAADATASSLGTASQDLPCTGHLRARLSLAVIPCGVGSPAARCIRIPKPVQDMYDTFPGFDTCIALIRSGNAHSSEQGYWWLEERAGQYTDRLVPLVMVEPNPFIRGFFVELLGDTKDAAVIPVLVGELSHCEQHVREWAVSSLEKIGTEQAKTFAQEYKTTHPEEYADAGASVSGGSR